MFPFILVVASAAPCTMGFIVYTNSYRSDKSAMLDSLDIEHPGRSLRRRKRDLDKVEHLSIPVRGNYIVRYKRML